MHACVSEQASEQASKQAVEKVSGCKGDRVGKWVNAFTCSRAKMVSTLSTLTLLRPATVGPASGSSLHITHTHTPAFIVGLEPWPYGLLLQCL